MKRLLFVTVFIIGTALSGQTTAKEFKYAKEGYLLLLELGIPDARYDFVPIEEFTYYPRSDDTVNMYKMIRTIDSSMAAIVLLETKKDYGGDIETKCIGVIVSPETSDKELIHESRLSLLFSQTNFYESKLNPDAFILDLVQRRFWPEYFP